MQLQNHIGEIQQENNFEDGSSQNQQSNIMESQNLFEYQNSQKIHYRALQQNWTSPLRQFSNSFSVFTQKRKPTDLSTFIKIKSQDQYQQILSQFKTYISIKQSNFNQNSNFQDITDKKESIKSPQEYFYSSQIPQNCTFVMIIKPLLENRCNIQVYNLSGFVIAYYNNIKRCKKFPKIFKLIHRLVKPCLFIIVDYISTNNFQLNNIQKIAEQCPNYMYIINDYTENLLQIQQNIIHSNQIFKIQQNQLVQRVDQKLYYFSRVFDLNDSECFFKVDVLIESLKKSKEEIFSLLKIQIPQEKRILAFDSLIVNIAKSYAFKSDDILNKILQLFQMQQQKIVEGAGEKKYGQKQWHTPQSMEECRDCLYCLKYNKLHKRKTKYRCQGCSAQLRKEIPLCITCFKKMHINNTVKRQILSQAIGKSKQIKKNPSKIKQKNKNFIKTVQDQQSPLKQIEKQKHEKHFNQGQSNHINVQNHHFGRVNRFCDEKIENYSQNKMKQQLLSSYNQNKMRLQQHQLKFQYLSQLKELTQLKGQIFQQIEELESGLKYELARKSLQFFLSRVIVATKQLQKKININLENHL